MGEQKHLVIGIDLGSSDSYVAYVGKGAIDVAQNEVSQRKTPSLVGFTERERLLGDQALSQIKSNVKNTCRYFKHLLGQRLDSRAVEAEQFWATCKLVEDASGFAACSVNFKGEAVTFSAVELTAMFLTKLKDIAEAWCTGTVSDVVIGVPAYFADFQRAALLDAASIAGLRVLRVMNEHTATALEYGYFRTNDFDPEKPTTVAFCMMGHVVFSVSIVQFFHGKLKVLCERSDKVGGRDMDECLIRTFAKQFEAKTGCDVLSNKKALFKLEDAVTKTKKILSANSESSLSCECLMDDHDFGSHIDRADFLEMCKPMMQRVNAVLEAAKAACGVPLQAIDAVEICGGASRVPWVKELCSNAFSGKELSTTMNADECVARGCALQAAILSPLYKVREFEVEDASKFPVSLAWSHVPVAATNGEGDGAVATVEKSLVLFPENSIMNLLKVITFFRKEPFEIKAEYADDKALLPGTPRHLGTYRIGLPSLKEAKRVKVKLALTLNGTFVLQSAHLLEEEEEEDGELPQQNGAAHAPPPAAAALETAEAAGNGQQAEGAVPVVDGAQDGAKDGKKRSEANSDALPQENAKRPRRLKRTDLHVSSQGAPGLRQEELARRRELERAMIVEMHDIEETNDKRNELESYILTMRSSVAEGGKYAGHISGADREALLGQLLQAEDWLYDHVDDGKQVFIEKLAELRQLADRSISCLQEAEAEAPANASAAGADAAAEEGLFRTSSVVSDKGPAEPPQPQGKATSMDVD